MWEVYELATQSYMIPLSLLFVLVVFYWITVLLGAVDTDFLNIEIDTQVDIDADIDMEVDVDADPDLSNGVPVGAMTPVLLFFNVGRAPLMIILSIFFASMWFTSIIGNHYFNPGNSTLLGFGIMAATIPIDAIMVKLLGAPVAWFFVQLDTDDMNPGKVEGKPCKVITTQITSDHIGQVEVQGKGAPMTLNAMTNDGSVIKQNENAVVINFDKEKRVYIVAQLGETL